MTADTTFQIKVILKNNVFLSKFKYYFNIAHSRESVQNLINEIQRTFISSVSPSSDSNLTAELSNIDTNKGLEEKYF